MASLYNSEGYYSPTEYEAFTRIEREERAARIAAAYRPLVYICSPFAGDTRRNIRKARKYSRFALMQHTIPFAPHLLFPQFMDDNNPAERSLAMKMNMIMLGRCEELWIFGDTISAGMKREIEKAKRKGISSAMMNGGASGTVINNYNNDNSRTVNQTNNSPKSLSRLEIYRQTRNALNV